MSIAQLKCSNTRPRGSADLTESQARIPNRRPCVQALSSILSSYQNQNRTQNPFSASPSAAPSPSASPASSASTTSPAVNTASPNGSPVNKRLSQKNPNPPNFSVPINTTPTSNRKSVQKTPPASTTPTTPPNTPAPAPSPTPTSTPTPTPPPTSRQVRIVIVGSDSTLHNVVTGYPFLFFYIIFFILYFYNTLLINLVQL